MESPKVQVSIVANRQQILIGWKKLKQKNRWEWAAGEKTGKESQLRTNRKDLKAGQNYDTHFG